MTGTRMLRALLGATLVGAFLVFALPVVWRADLAVYDDHDERISHLPAALAFADAWPTPDLSDYDANTPPLYHLTIAAASRITGTGTNALRTVNALLAAACLAVVYGWLSRTGRLGRAALGTAALGLSPYFLGPAVRLGTDDFGLLWVFLALSLWDDPPPEGAGTGRARWRAFAAGAAAAAATLTRQVHLWTVAPGLVAALRARSWPDRLGRAALACLPVVLFAPLVVLWGGTSPPSYADWARASVNLDVLVYAVATFGALALFWSPWLGCEANSGRGARIGTVAAAAAGVLLLVLHPLPWHGDPLRWGGSLWTLASRFPPLLGTPVLFWILVPIGAAALLLLARVGWRRGDLGPAVTLAAFLAANLASPRAYQKYWEPFAIVMIARAVRDLPDRPRRALLGPALLVGGTFAVDVVRFWW